MSRAFLALLAVVVVACQAGSPPATSAPPTASVARSLAVIVSAPAGAPVAGASVCAFTVAGTQVGCGETGASGTARLSLRAGTYPLQVTPPAGSRLGAAKSWADVLDADATTVVQLEPRSTITGTVKDERGAPVADAEVCAHAPSSLSPTCARTRAQGEYTIEVRSDVYRLEVSGPPGGKLLSQWAVGRLGSDDADVVDVRTKDASGIGVTLVKGVLLTGIVRGPSGPIEDAQICTRTLAAPIGWDCDRSKKNGSYLLLREPGEYYVWVVPPDNVRLLAQWYDHVLVGVDTTSVTIDRDRSIDFSLDPGPQLRGVVRTTDGVPVQGVLVCVDTPFPTGRICRPTNGDGVYQVTTRPATYVVQVVAPPSTELISEFWLGKRNWTEADEVSLGSSDRTLDLTVRKGVRVSGVVRDTRGIPLEAATINIVDDSGPLIGTDTDASGTFNVVVLPGSYKIEVFAPFRGERGDLLSMPAKDIVVSGFTRYDAVLEDANP